MEAIQCMFSMQLAGFSVKFENNIKVFLDVKVSFSKNVRIKDGKTHRNIFLNIFTSIRFIEETDLISTSVCRE